MLIPVVIAVGAVLVLSHIAPFRFLIDAFHGDRSIWRVTADASDKPVFLTFDDGPNATATPQLLALLKEKNVRSTFFLIGEYVNENTAPIVQTMFADGHCVAQHTGRRWLLLRSPAHVKEYLEAGARKIELLSGNKPARLFRPHAGWRSAAMFRGAARAGYKIVGWSWMSWDWTGLRQRTGPGVAKQIVRHAGPGKIVVIHDGHHRNPQADRAYAIEAVGTIVDELRSGGYTFRTLCEVSE